MYLLGDLSYAVELDSYSHTQPGKRYEVGFKGDKILEGRPLSTRNIE